MLALLAALAASIAPGQTMAGPVGVSPGEAGRLVETETRCPTFTWAAMPEARGYELVLFRLAPDEAGVGGTPAPVFRKAFSEGVTGWTPALGDCLERGAAYAWVVRAIDDARRGPEAEDWSEPRLFRVSPAPSLAEVDRALEVLRAYREATLGDGVAAGAVGASKQSVRPRGEAAGSQGARPVSESGDAIAGVVFDAVAVEGEVAGATGINVGVHGLSASSDTFAAGVVGEATATTGFTIGTIGSSASSGGAGVGAFATDPIGGVGLFARSEGTAGAAIDAEANADSGTAIGILARASAPGGAALKAAHRDPTGGPDLVLDGSEQFVTDTALTESGLVRSSAGAETFSFSNPGGGSLAVDIDGVEVVTTATDQDTLGGLICAEGEVAKLSSGSWVCATDEGESYSAGNQLELSGTTFNVLEGASSGLDADSLDGLDSTQLAPASHLHTGADIVAGSLGTATLADGAVTGAKILDHSIALGDLPGDTACPAGTYLHKYLDGLGGWACEPLQTLADLLQVILPPPEPPSLFGTFGGGNYSGAGDVVISTPQLYSGVHTVANFTVAPGGTALVDSGFLFVGAQERCTIQGSILAKGVVLGASIVDAAGAAVGRPGRRANFVEAGFGMVGSLSSLPVDLALAGSGGGGGGANAGGGAASSLLSRGGDGGGAAGPGGPGGCVGCGSLNGGNATVDFAKRARLTGGEFQGHPVRTDNFASLLLFPGASGGSGAVGGGGGTGGGGGNGGGVVYLECNELDFSGSIDVSGDPGGPGTGDAGGGGGGGGGVILIRYRTLIGTVTGTVSIGGGAGSTGAGSGGAGGAGGVGFADVVGLQ